MPMDKFRLVSKFEATGDQPQAIEKLVDGVNKGFKEQVLLGVTGSGKTFTMANIINRVNRPTLVLAHNKTLAAQLCSEFKEFFPNNAVEYFVSYFLSYWQNAHFKPFFRDSLMLFGLKKLKKPYGQVTSSGTSFHTVFCVPSVCNSKCSENPCNYYKNMIYSVCVYMDWDNYAHFTKKCEKIKGKGLDNDDG